MELLGLAATQSMTSRMTSKGRLGLICQTRRKKKTEAPLRRDRTGGSCALALHVVLPLALCLRRGSCAGRFAFSHALCLADDGTRVTKLSTCSA